MHIHLDIVGGISGDIFCSAMLDAFPELASPLQTFLSALPLFAGYSIQLAEKRQKEIVGKSLTVAHHNSAVVDTQHFIIKAESTAMQPVALNPNMQSQHQHYSWQDILNKLQQIKKHTSIYQCAVEIYTILAKAESAVHGIELNKVHLHEVGADDAIIDIISAAFLIHHCGVVSWSCSSLPWGQGVIHCAHGELPVPAPAVLKILVGFDWFHDNEVGERITPTGAAILTWLMKNQSQTSLGSLLKQGYGCGNRIFKNKPNILRVTVFAQNNQSPQFKQDINQDMVYVVQCDIDDMTNEEIAISQDKLRTISGVIDLTSHNIMGKKGRWMTRLELLCKPSDLSAICQQVLLETSSLGVRYWQAERIKLVRDQLSIHSQNSDWPVKVAIRPDGSITAKLEADAIQSLNQSHHERHVIKNEIEQLAIHEYLRSSKGKQQDE